MNGNLEANAMSDRSASIGATYFDAYLRILSGRAMNASHLQRFCGLNFLRKLIDRPEIINTPSPR